MLREVDCSSVYGERISISKPSFSPSGYRRLVQVRIRIYCLKVVASSRKYSEQGRVKLSDVQFERRGNKRRALTDDGARRVIKQKKALDSQLRKNQPGARPLKWIRRSPAQMAQFLADGRLNYRFNKYVDKALRTITKLASKRRDSYDFGVVMNPWVGALSFKDMCVILREQKNLDLACDFFHWMKLQGSYIPSVIAYTILLRKCGEAGKFDLVERYYIEMLQEGCEPDEVVICSLISLFGKSGRIDEMMDFYSMMRTQGLAPPIVVFNIMLSSLYKAGLYNDAIDIWNNLLGFRVKPNDYTYAVVVNVLRKQRKPVEALDVFDEMIKEGHLPDEILYGMVMKMMGDLGMQNRVMELYNRMKSHGLMLSKHTYTYLVHYLTKIGKFQLAVTIFSEMQSLGLPADEVIYGTIISIYSELGMFTDAEEAFKEMDEAGLIVSDRVFVLMATVRMKGGEFSSALELFDEMQSRGFEMTKYAWVTVLQCCLRQQKLSDAESAFDIMLSQGFADAIAFTCMFSLYKKVRMLEAGKALLSKLEASSVVPDEELYNAILSHLCSEGSLPEADSYLSKMQMKGFSATGPVKTMLMRTYGKAGRVLDAESIYVNLEPADAMAMSVMFSVYDESGNQEAAMGVSECLLDSDVKFYNKFMSKYARRGAWDTVNLLCTQMLMKGLMPSEEVLISAIDMLRRNEQCQRALQLIEQGHNFGLHFSPTIYDAVITTCINCGQERDADLLLEIKDKLGFQVTLEGQT